MEKIQPEPKQSQKESANQPAPAEPQLDAKKTSPPEKELKVLTGKAAVEAMLEQGEETIKLENVREDRALRNHFAGIALREIVRWQVAERKAGQEDVAATWAFRYADRMMSQAVKRPSRASVNVRGVPGVTEEPMIEVQ